MIYTEKKDNEISVEDIMLQIKNNIKNRDINCVNIETIENGETVYRDDLSQNFDYINSNYNIRSEYCISSHRPILGRFLVWGRKFVHGEIRRYVDQIVNKQEEFNFRVVKILNMINENVGNKINTENVNKGTKKNNTDKTMNYFLFEEKYRGTTENIKKNQSVFVEYFKNCHNVLDIGCGRGEFLSLLKENGIPSKGIDTNEDMVLYCRRMDLEIVQNDALNYLISLKDKSLDGIFLGQVVEHLQPEDMITLIKLCYDKLQYGSYIIVETINPLCIYAHQWFHMDLSHVKFIHPETTKFLLESVRFRNVEFKSFSPVPEELMLKKLDVASETEDNKIKYEVMNQNFEKLNQFLYGNQDYAVIAKK